MVIEHEFLELGGNFYFVKVRTIYTSYLIGLGHALYLKYTKINFVIPKSLKKFISQPIKVYFLLPSNVLTVLSPKMA